MTSRSRHGLCHDREDQGASLRLLVREAGAWKVPARARPPSEAFSSAPAAAAAAAAAQLRAERLGLQSRSESDDLPAVLGLSALARVGQRSCLAKPSRSPRPPRDCCCLSRAKPGQRPPRLSVRTWPVIDSRFDGRRGRHGVACVSATSQCGSILAAC